MPPARLPVVFFLLVCQLGRPVQARADGAQAVGDGAYERYDWGGRVGVFLGPQYFLKRDDQVQFSFGAEGHLRLTGPLSASLSAGIGVIAEPTTLVAAGLRLHLLRRQALSLALDARGGVWIRLPSDRGPEVQPAAQAGLELAHDLGRRFAILLRASFGHQGGDGHGWMLDAVVGLGLLL